MKDDATMSSARARRGRPPGRVFDVKTWVYLTSEQAEALDSARVGDPARPNRSDLLRRVLTEWLVAQGHLTVD